MTQAQPNPPRQRHFFAPDIPQNSSLDGGLSALKCVLDGYGFLTDARQLTGALRVGTEITSLERIAEVAKKFGLGAKLTLTPIDHLLMPLADNLPAIVVGRQLTSNPNLRFLVIWRRHGPWLQVMEPGIGLRWVATQKLLDELEIAARPIAAHEWREQIATNGFVDLLHQRLINLNLGEEQATQLVTGALLDDPTWRSTAILDAATRAVDVGVRAGGWQSGEAAGKMIEHSLRDVSRLQADWIAQTKIPQDYWSVVPRADSNDQLVMRGVEFIRINPLQIVPLPQPANAQAARLPSDAKKPQRWRIEVEMWKAVRADGVITPAILGIGLALSTIAVAIEALFLRGMIQVGEGLDSTLRIGVMGVLLSFFVILALLRLPINSIVMRMGRRLETRMRIALLEKIPRLSNRFFLDRPAADLNRRAYALRELREAPDLLIQFLQGWFQLLVTAVCICLLEPTSIFWVVFSILTALLVTRLADPFMGTSIYRCFTHTNTLNLFYLDSLLGLVPARTHSAERAIRREHAGALLDLMHADVQRTIRFAIFFSIVSMLPALWTIGIVFNYVERGGTAENMLLLTYWTLNIPILLEQASNALITYMQRCRPAAVSLAQVLEAPEETTSNVSNLPNVPNSAAVSIRMNNVGVQIGNSTLLANINLAIRPGEHVAVVGTSGAGKTSMVGLLLGWHRPTTGELFIDNEPLEGERLYALRQATAWIDTGVQLWNRSLLANLRYGARRSSITPIAPVVRDADLLNVLTTLPNGLQTLLGESGRLVSGGEGQRVRLGRVLFRAGVRLAILDEPFRALDRPSRRKLLAQTRKHWKDATLILISHDVADVQNFERVLVMEHGRIVEDGAPIKLAARPGSRYRALLDAEQLAQQTLWGSATWRRLWLSDGLLSDAERGNGHN